MFTLAFGSIAAPTSSDIFLVWETLGQTENVPALGMLAQYTGDNDAFEISSGALADGNVYPFFVGPSSIQLPYHDYAGWPYQIDAIDLDDGVEKTGTLSVYRRATPEGQLDDLMAVITLSKTYNAP